MRADRVAKLPRLEDRAAYPSSCCLSHATGGRSLCCGQNPHQVAQAWLTSLTEQSEHSQRQADAITESREDFYSFDDGYLV